MRLLAFAVYDAKAGAYLRPFFANSAGEAIRSFGDAVNSDTPFGKHPEDYTLFAVGSFDDSDALLQGEHHALGNALEMVSRDESQIRRVM